jgi:HPr kinase/phosphorylase
MQDIARPDLSNTVSPGRIQLHGVLARVLDTGVLLIGESGIGKSECALELVTKGHQLVADDVVDVVVTPDGLVGKAPELTSELLEIRGLGILNIREIFGDRAACAGSTIDICVEFLRSVEVERIENVVGSYEIVGHSIPKFTLPVSSGRNLSTLVEVAARIFIKDGTGQDAAHILLEKHQALLDLVR